MQIEWKGQTATIRPEDGFKLAERLEDIATLGEVAGWAATPKFAKLARCYVAILGHYGIRAKPEEVHSQMLADVKAGKGESMVIMAITAVIHILMDGAPEGDGSEGKTAGHSSEQPSAQQ